jgi:lactase-phlorizin hydrolase
MLAWIAHEYNNPPVFVTENGFSDGGILKDVGRIKYLKVSINICT